MPWPTFKALRIGRPASKDDLLELVNREVMPLLKQLRDWLMSIQGTTQGYVWTLENDGAGGVTPVWSPPAAWLDAKVVLLASETSIIDFTAARKVTLVLDQNVAALTIVPPALSANQAAHCSLVVRQDSIGGRTIGAYSSNVLWPSGTAPTITAAANAADVLAFIADGDESVMRGMYTQGFTA